MSERAALEDKIRSRVCSIRHRFPDRARRDEVGTVMPGWTITVRPDAVVWIGDWLDFGSEQDLRRAVKRLDAVIAELGSA